MIIEESKNVPLLEKMKEALVTHLKREATGEVVDLDKVADLQLELLKLDTRLSELRIDA